MPKGVSKNDKWVARELGGPFNEPNQAFKAAEPTQCVTSIVPTRGTVANMYTHIRMLSMFFSVQGWLGLICRRFHEICLEKTSPEHFSIPVFNLFLVISWPDSIFICGTHLLHTVGGYD